MERAFWVGGVMFRLVRSSRQEGEVVISDGWERVIHPSTRPLLRCRVQVWVYDYAWSGRRSLSTIIVSNSNVYWWKGLTGRLPSSSSKVVSFLPGL